MVKLEPVEDEHFTQQQPGPIIDGLKEDDEDFTDTDSEISEASSADDLDETLADRLLALRDILPPKQRAALVSTVSTGYHWVTTSLRWGGKGLWVLSTSALLLGVPFALAITEETQLMEMEKEMKAQQTANELVAPGAATQEARPAL